MKEMSIADESILRLSMSKVEEALRNIGVSDVLLLKGRVSLVYVARRGDGDVPELWESEDGKTLVEAYEELSKGVRK